MQLAHYIEVTLTRAKFDQLTQDLVERTKKSVHRALSDAGLSASDIDQVLLVGRINSYSSSCEAVRKRNW